MPDLQSLKQVIRRRLGIANTQALGRLDIETNVTTVADTTERTRLRLWNKDDAINSEYLELRSRGTDGYVIEVGKTGSGSTRNLIIRNGGIDVWYIANNGDTYFTGNFLAVYDTRFIIADPTSTNFYVLRSSNIAANRDITLPLLTANDVFVFEKFIQNLEGKTFKPSTADSGIIVPIKPSFTTIVNNTARAELRIHNVDDATNDEYLRISALGTDGFKLEILESGTGVYRQFRIYNGGVQCVVFDTNGQIHFTQIPVFDNNLWIADSDFSHNYQILRSNLAANRQITLPLLTANDVFVFEAHQQGLSNKTTLDFVETADPANPAANHGVVWFDDTDEHLKVKKSDGTVVDLEATGGGTPREELVAQWYQSSTKTNIGTAYVDIYTATGSEGKPVWIDFTGKTQYRVVAYWNKVGTGTQQLKFCDAAAPTTNILHNFSNIVSNENDSGLQTLPAFATGRSEIKMMALSSTGADDPIFENAVIYLK